MGAVGINYNYILEKSEKNFSKIYKNLLIYSILIARSTVRARYIVDSGALRIISVSRLTKK